MQPAIDAYISTRKNETFNYRQVAYAIGHNTPAEQRAVSLYLAGLAFEGTIIETSPGKYKAPNRPMYTNGTFVRRSNGKNSVITDNDNEEIFVAEHNSMHALNGDKVEITIAARRRGHEPEAIVTGIIEKKEQTFIGTLKLDRHYAFLLTDSKYLATDIFVPKNKLRKACNGDKVTVRITDWPEDSKNPIGEVVEILGKTGDNNAEMHAILAEFGLPYHYPENIEEAAAKIDAGITHEVIARRLDMRDVTTFTIDPQDAKDFDDALSYRILPNGNIEIGVHIADVTHYVKPSTALDKEAQKRATSVYLVDRVVPMLPEHLSNGICSLRPNEDKLTFSVIFEMDKNAKVIKSQIAKTVIRSNRRFSYEEAQNVIESGQGDYVEEILTLNKLAKILKKNRYDLGSVNFDRAEVKFNLDENGHPVSVYLKEIKDANNLIEEFMLLANKTVAERTGIVPKNKKPKAFVYRVHEQPDPEKLANLATIARVFGYSLKTVGEPKEINRSLNKMLATLKGKQEETYISTLAVRAMPKAIYTSKNIGHYGLGFEYYTHFTSPIRRYPDMIVHRLLERYLAGGRSVANDKLEEECKHCSEMEQLAMNAERASIKYKQVEFMRDHLGDVFTGAISGVTEWGIFVELDENKCEGLIPVRDLAYDYYDFDATNYCLKGYKNNNCYRLGDKITVQVAQADLMKKQLTFVIVDENNPPRNINTMLSKRTSDRSSFSEKVGHNKKFRRRK